MIHPSERSALLRPGMLVGGTWLDRGGAGELEHVNPSTGKVQATFPAAGPDEVDRAVAAARAARAAWRRWAPADPRGGPHRLGARGRTPPQGRAAPTAR